ncbi:hypothetical protein CDL12_22361 [Handroanthus impetiginosus]|uniref:RIN4 pathogenic type III effector avirulence factor Avr cleavage site domain-containing protein n=1 Tax=Handroanthus impetiginosus TaxID=429701 RepID=A0A2G9GIF8_9LAMI|nr:hypothetical protein CDL12_22361 [Handroanthus impetiginosus]
MTENVALPKFGSWDVNNPEATGQYSMIFDRARNDKRTGHVSRDHRDSPRGCEIMPLTKLTKPSAGRRWLCCSNLKYAED